MALGLTTFLRSRCWEQLVFNQSDGPGLVAKVAIALSILDFQHSFVGISASQWPPKQAISLGVSEIRPEITPFFVLFSLFGDKSNTSMDMSGSGRILPLPNVLVHLLSYNLVAAAGTELWLTWEKQESGAGMIWPSNLAPKIQSSYPLVRSNSSVVERLGEKYC